MPVSYLHGIETVSGNTGVIPIQTVKTAVIGLVGIAPEGETNKAILVQSRLDAAQFGHDLPGFDIPKALSIILAMGAGPVIVVNGFDADANLTEVTNESHTITDGKLKLSYVPVGAVTVNDSAGDASSLVKDTDYSLDKYGNFVALSSDAANGTVLKFTYSKLNAVSVASSQIIGETDVDNNRTGMQCWDESMSLFGFMPKILIAPNYSSVNAVASELKSKADKYRAFTYLDAPYGTTVGGALEGRGIASTINFKTAHKRTELVYPFIKAYDPATDAPQDFAYAAFMAGMRSQVDKQEGYWVSTSNHEIPGGLGTAVVISGGYNDSDTDANLLNEQGISTVVNRGGLRTWGNRNASYPTNTAPDSFSTDVRTADIIHESIENGLFPYVDKPISRAILDVVGESANAFVRTLISRGALVAGSKVIFPKEFNTPTDLAAGHVTYELIRMVPPPMERITIRDTIDINLLKNLV